MEILPLLIKLLKDDLIIEILDDWDVEVPYDFDRSPAGEWIRLDYPEHRVHYDFRDGELHILTR